MRELLKEIQRINRELIRVERRKNQLAGRALRVTSALSPVRYDRSENQCKHEEAVLEQSALEFEAAAMRQALQGLREELSVYLERMEMGLFRALARQRFMEGLSCAAIARKMNYNRTYVYRMLDTAEETLVTIQKGGDFGGFAPSHFSASQLNGLPLSHAKNREPETPSDSNL